MMIEREGRGRRRTGFVLGVLVAGVMLVAILDWLGAQLRFMWSSWFD